MASISATARSLAVSSAITRAMRSAAARYLPSPKTLRTAAAISVGAADWSSRITGASVHHTGGDVELVAAHRQADDRHAGGQRLERRAMAAMRDDKLRLRAGPRDAEPRSPPRTFSGAGNVAGSMPWPVVTIARTGSAAEGLDDPAQQLLLTLKAGAERDQNERLIANRRRPPLRPEWIVEPGTDVLYDRRQRRDEVERPARQHEHACGTPCLVEDMLERGEALLGAGGIERRQGLVPCSHHRRAQLVMLTALGLGARRHQPCPEWRNTRRRHDVDRRVEDDAWDAGRLCRDKRAEEQELGEDRSRPLPFELLAHVGSERRRGADGEPVPYPRELLGRARTPNRG